LIEKKKTEAALGCGPAAEAREWKQREMDDFCVIEKKKPRPEIEQERKKPTRVCLGGIKN